MATKNSLDWKLQGDYFEGCNCDSICPCIFLLDPDKGYCNATVAWHIEKGHYAQTQLDGLNAVAVFVAPGNMFTGPKMKPHSTWINAQIKSKLMLYQRYSQVNQGDSLLRRLILSEKT